MIQSTLLQSEGKLEAIPLRINQRDQIQMSREHLRGFSNKLGDRIWGRKSG